MSKTRDESNMRDMSGTREFGDKSDKPMAGFVTALFVVPAVLLCCLGPVVALALLSGAAGGLAGWLAGLDSATVVVAVFLVLAAVVWGARRALKIRADAASGTRSRGAESR